MSDYAIDAHHIGLRFTPDTPAILDDCSMQVRYGEFVLLSGPSGSGKSTLLSLINGLIPSTIAAEVSGSIRIDGEDIQGKRISEIARAVGSVLQNADSQIVHTRVEDEIAFGCENRALPVEEIRQRVEDTCRMMQLDKDAFCSQLSGGQKQRLITASTLAMGQKILVFDEPLANLDIEGAQMLLRLLRQLCSREGYTVLFVEHRLDMVLPYVDRVFWLEHAKLQEVGRDEWSSLQGRGRIPDSGLVDISDELCLAVEHISYCVSGRQILRDISFDVHKGERIVILGENGCGKTTLLKILARLLKPTSGRIEQFLDSRVGQKASPQWFGLCGYVYQNPNYQLFMPRVDKEIAYGAHSESDARRCMEEFRLEELAEQHPQSLSEGQKRRVGIAAIAACRPQLLLLDEPTVGQDFANLEMMIKTLNETHGQRGMTMLTVTHDVRCAAALADRVLWIRDGVVRAQGGKELIAEYEQACAEQIGTE